MAAEKLNLVVFDIDGTLTNTNKVDGECFKKTFSALHDIHDLSTDWGSYDHSTDSGIIDQIFKERFSRPPSAKELSAFISFFVGELEKEYRRGVDAFAPMRGVPLILKEIERRGWTWAVATGAWKKSAEFKLAKGGIDIQNQAAAFAEDAFARREIIKTAISRAEKLQGIDQFDRIVYVGDGYWDQRAAFELGLPFIHITQNRDSAHYLADYHDQALVLKILDSAFVPYQG